MASPQKEKGFTPIAHEILEAIQFYKFTLNELKIIMCVWRFTYGFNRKSHHLSLGFFEKHTGLNRSRINAALSNLLEHHVLTKEVQGDAKNTNVFSFNKNYESWTIEKYSNFTSVQIETSVQKDTSVKDETSTSVQDETSTSVQFDTQERNIKESIKESIYTIFNHWKSKGIIAHKKLNVQMTSHINARLEEYSIDNLLKAIDNYNEILNSDSYYWTHRWTLQDFMKPNNVVRFMDSSKPFDTFLSSKGKKHQNNDVDWEAI